MESGDRDAFLTVFLREIADVSDEQIVAMRADPSWSDRVATAHTALRELPDDYRFDPARFHGLDVPTLLLLGGNSSADFKASRRALDAALPNSRIAILKGQGHTAMNTATELPVR